MTKIKKGENTKCWGGCRKTDHSHIAGRNVTGTATLGNSLAGSYHTKCVLLYPMVAFMG